MFLIVFCWLLLCNFPYASCQFRRPGDHDEHVIMGKMLKELANDVIKNQNEKLHLLTKARQENSVSAPYEVGYMVQTIQEHYRRMLDKWRSTRIDIRIFYNFEVLMYLEEIENLYWSIKHEVYMLHEIERKYRIRTPMNETHKDATFNPGGAHFEEYPFPAKYNTPKPFKPNKFMQNIMNPQTNQNDKGGKVQHTPKLVRDKNNKVKVDMSPYISKRPKSTYFPRDYGWDLYEFNSDT